MPRRAGVVIATTLFVLWLVVGVAVVGTIAFEALTMDDARDCHVDSLNQVGEVSWQTWPPGSVCTYTGIEYRAPSATRGWALIGLVVVGAGLLAFWRVQRDAPEPDWMAE